jgi:DNA modification methylase
MAKKEVMLTWHTEQRKVSDLVATSYNPRKISEADKKELTKSLQKFNLAEIPAINTNNTILAGHQRIAILLALGRGNEVIDVRVPSRKLTKSEADEYMIRSNKNTGEWDFSMLSKHFDFSFLKDTGFNDFELDNIFERFCKEDDFDSEKEYAKIATPKTKTGDIYILGSHRLMCGSSADAKDFARLMSGKKANLIFTDPPYNVNYHSPDGLSYDSAKYGGTCGQIFNDNLSDADCLKFYTDVLNNLHKFSVDNVTLYWWFANSNSLINSTAFKNTKWKHSQTIIWLKNSSIVSRSQDYNHAYESCMLGWKRGKAHYKEKNIKNYSDVVMLDKNTFAEQLDVWYEKRDNTAKYVHPTQKPVRLAERALKKNSKSKDIVVDGFGGSGSTLIACEQMNRPCYVMEFDPKYCDVIVRRWELFTNQKAKLLRG